MPNGWKTGEPFTEPWQSLVAAKLVAGVQRTCCCAPSAGGVPEVYTKGMGAELVWHLDDCAASVAGARDWGGAGRPMVTGVGGGGRLGGGGIGAAEVLSRGIVEAALA